MLNYNFWYNIVQYGNTNWRGKFTEKEMNEMANNYSYEWNLSIRQNKLSSTIINLMDSLNEDRDKVYLPILQKEIDKLSLK